MNDSEMHLIKWKWTVACWTIIAVAFFAACALSVHGVCK